MKDFWSRVGAQFVSILLTALLAGLIAFLQSLLASSGALPSSPSSPEDVGLLGGVLKLAHAVLSADLLKKTL